MADESQFFRKEPRQSRSRALVTALLQASDQLLSGGADPGQLSVQQIAQRAGVGIASIYDYFSDREKLFSVFLSRVTASNFSTLSQVLESARSEPFELMVGKLLDATLDSYLAQPTRTRGLLVIIARLGWAGPVIAERDRFAGLIAKRMLEVRPELQPDRAQAVARVVCDAVMGVVLGELWRDSSPDRLKTARDQLHAMVRAYVAAVMG
jgi:AcrR family transcriptional regulator